MTASESAPDRVRLRHELAKQLAYGKWGKTYILSHEQARWVLTAEGRQIIRELTDEDPPESVEGLAERVEHLKPQKVHQTLTMMIDIGLVGHSGEDEIVDPYLKPDTITVEPVVADIDSVVKE